MVDPWVFSSWTTAQATTGDTVPPGAPPLVSATATTTTATIVWNASSRGTYVTSGYQTSWRLADGTWADPTDGAVNVLTHTVRNLTPNRSYQLRVRAYSAHDGTRYYSGWTSATVSTGASQAIQFLLELLRWCLRLLPQPQLRSYGCLLYTSPSPRDRQKSRMPSSA